MSIRSSESLESVRQIKQREAVFLRYGYDSAASLNFVLAKALPLAGHVLEIGTGKGRFLALLAAHTQRITTVDTDASQQRAARLHVPMGGGHIRYAVHNAEQLPWSDASFGSAVSVNTFHHLERPQAVLNEMLRVLKAGGKLVIADFSPRGFQIFDRIHRAEGRTHPRLTKGLAEFQDLLRQRGFTTRRYKGCNQEVLVAQSRPFHKPDNHHT